MPPARTSSTWAWSAGAGPWSSPERAARSSPSPSPRAPPGRSTWRSASAPKDPSCHRGRQATGPARRRPDRPPGYPARRDRQGRQPAHTATRFHHRRPRRWGPAARRAGGWLPRRPAHHPCATTGRGPAWTGTPPLCRHLHSPTPGARYVPSRGRVRSSASAYTRSPYAGCSAPEGAERHRPPLLRDRRDVVLPLCPRQTGQKSRAAGSSLRRRACRRGPRAGRRR